MNAIDKLKKKDQKTVIQVLRWVTTFYIKSFVTTVSKKIFFFHSGNCLKRRFYAEIFKENFTQESYLQNQDSKSNEK